MKLRLLFLAAVLLLTANTGVTFGQTQPPPSSSDPFETGWSVSVSGGYTNVSNAQTNNGYFFSSAVRVAQHWNMRADIFILNSPQVTIAVAGPEYRLSINHILPQLSGNFPIINNMELFANAKLGDAKYTDPAKGSQSKFAYGVGTGFDIAVSDTVTVRPLDVSYIRSSLLTGGVVLGNHMQFEAGLGLRF